MADIDINDFSDCDKMAAHPNEMGETIPLTPGGAGEGSYLGTRVRNVVWGNEAESKSSQRRTSQRIVPTIP